jgi:hypothetical protein
MNIAVYSPVLEDAEGSSFIVETPFLLSGEHSEHRFVIITDQKSGEQFASYSNIKTVHVKPFSKNAVLRKIWWDIKLPAILNKGRSVYFIS